MPGAQGRARPLARRAVRCERLARVTSTGNDPATSPRDLPEGWTVGEPDENDVAELLEKAADQEIRLRDDVSLTFQ